MNSKINKALRLLESGKISDAKKLFQEILVDDPDQIDALHGLGLIFAEKKDYKAALNYIKKAVLLAPSIAPFHNNLANTYKKMGDTDQALRHYRETLKIQPAHANALNNIGVLLYQQGQYKKAIEYLKKSLRVNPKFVNTHFNLALCYIQLELLLEAVPHLEEVLKLNSEHLGAMHNLGIALCTLKDYSNSEKLLQKICQKEPHNLDALFHAGISLAAINQHEKAIEYYLSIIKQNPNHAKAHHNLAISYLNKNKKDNALFHFERCIKLDSSNKTALHMLKALRGESSPEGAPKEYTRALFNQYAFHYDEHVLNTLKLKTPQLIREAFSPITKQIKTPCKLLDLGCGTGICARYFNDITDTIYGIDLSENMLIVAKKNGGYFKLICDDILNFLSTTDEKFDAIIASDTLVYFSELDTLFKLCKKVLNTPGYFGFSVEFCQNSTNYDLANTGRYQHSQDYIKKVATRSDFKIISLKKETIRLQDQQNIAGLIVLLALD